MIPIHYLHIRWLSGKKRRENILYIRLRANLSFRTLKFPMAGQEDGEITLINDRWAADTCDGKYSLLCGGPRSGVSSAMPSFVPSPATHQRPTCKVPPQFVPVVPVSRDMASYFQQPWHVMLITLLCTSRQADFFQKAYLGTRRNI